MEITRLNYPIRTKKKFRVIYNKKEYTCYLHPCGNNLVVTGNGKTEDCQDVTNTNLGAEIIIACSNYYHNEVESVMNHYDEGCKKWSELLKK